MRLNAAGLLTAALICVCGVASANIIYNVNITDGTETVSGTITTDGSTGTLAPADITAWDLTATGPVAFSINSAPPGALFCVPGDCGLQATLSSLTYDFSDPLAGLVFSSAGRDILLSPGQVLVLTDYPGSSYCGAAQRRRNRDGITQWGTRTGNRNALRRRFGLSRFRSPTIPAASVHCCLASTVQLFRPKSPLRRAFV